MNLRVKETDGNGQSVLANMAYLVFERDDTKSLKVLKKNGRKWLELIVDGNLVGQFIRKLNARRLAFYALWHIYITEVVVERVWNHT